MVSSADFDSVGRSSILLPPAATMPNASTWCRWFYKKLWQVCLFYLQKNQIERLQFSNKTSFNMTLGVENCQCGSQ